MNGCLLSMDDWYPPCGARLLVVCSAPRRGYARRYRTRSGSPGCLCKCRLRTYIARRTLEGHTWPKSECNTIYVVYCDVSLLERALDSSWLGGSGGQSHIPRANSHLNEGDLPYSADAHAARRRVVSRHTLRGYHRAWVSDKDTYTEYRAVLTRLAGSLQRLRGSCGQK